MDTIDESWSNYFSKEELEEITSYKTKDLDSLPQALNNYLEELKQLIDIDELKQKLSQETTSFASEWIRCTALDFLKLFKHG